MANSCVYVPSKGKTLFKQLRNQFGYSQAVPIFYTAIHPDFVKQYEGLELDSEGIPTYNSLMRNKYIQEMLEVNAVIASLQKNFLEVDDTQQNYDSELNSAMNFNKTSPFNDKYIAYVQKNNNKLRVTIAEKTLESMDTFKRQYGTNLLNKRLADIFKPIGITVGKLSKIEEDAGRVGLTDFSMATKLTQDFSSIIKVANNMEGTQAISEEFSHLIIGTFIEEPLVQRALTLLVNNPELLKSLLGDQYEDVVKFNEGDMTLVAEEALGQLFKESLLEESTGLKSPVFDRMMQKLIKNFSKYDVTDLQNILNEVTASMSNLAKDILNSTKNITEEDILRNKRIVRLNALSKTVDINTEILKDALKIEQKRKAITKGTVKKKAEDTIKLINTYLSPNSDTVFGILQYAKSAIEQMQSLETQYADIGNMEVTQKFSLLRKSLLYSQSYGQFISALTKAIGQAKENQEEGLLKEYTINDNVINLEILVKELNNLSSSLAETFFRHAKPALIAFFKPFFGELVTIKSGPNKGDSITVEKLIERANSDISITDLWLDSMGDSADTLLQLFDAAVKKAKDNAREETIRNITAIQALRIDAERLGITDFEYIFERDSEGNKTGNYISEVNYGQYQLDRKNFIEEVNKKYGKNPTGEQAKNKIEEIRAWNKIHTISFSQPNPDFYHNKEYDKLQGTDKMKILNRFYDIKGRFDALLPGNRVSLTKAIQLRKSGTQRFIESASSPSTLFDNIKESIKDALIEQEDDDTLFGDTSTKNLTTFDNKEFMTIPVLYTNRLKNPEELSDDVFASLMSYGYMANTYKEVSDILDPLEVGRTFVKSDNREVTKTRGFQKIEGVVIDNESSNIAAKLDYFMASQVYQRYLADSGAWEILGKNVNKQKFVGLLLKGSSLAQQGFNYLANIANTTTGVAMQNIEAACGQHFNIKELFQADKEYIAAMKDFMPELNSRLKTNKLSLFTEKLNIKQDYEQRVRNKQKSNWLERIFGQQIAFFGQEAGDHWLYHRTAIAMCCRMKVYVGKMEVSLWDALEIKNVYKDNNEIKELVVPEGTRLVSTGELVNFSDIGRKIMHVNHGLFGIYNKEDQNKANSVIGGKLLQQYRKWIKPQMNKRFQAGQHSVVMNEFEEGYYRTVVRLGGEILRGKVQFVECFESLDDWERQNILRAVTELFQTFCIWALANWVEWPDDKKRPWALKLAEYSVKRLAHETGGLTPSTIMIGENLKTIKEPIAMVGLLQDCLNLFNSVLDPSDWTDEISSGPYKGLSTVEKNFIKSPIPIVAQYRQISKFAKEIDNSMIYYTRPSY